MNNKLKPKKPVISDWHPADIIAELRKKRLSLRRLSVSNGYSPTYFAQALVGKNAIKAEQAIAKAIGIEPCVIWPTRYTLDGARIVQRIRKDAPCNVTLLTSYCNGNKVGAK